MKVFVFEEVSIISLNSTCFHHINLVILWS